MGGGKKIGVKKGRKGKQRASNHKSDRPAELSTQDLTSVVLDNLGTKSAAGARNHGLIPSKNASESSKSSVLPGKFMDVGYNGAQMTLNLLRQKHREVCQKKGWMRHPELQRLAEQFLLKHKLAKLAKQRVDAGLGNSLFKPSNAQLDAFENELVGFVDGKADDNAAQHASPADLQSPTKAMSAETEALYMKLGVKPVSNIFTVSAAQQSSGGTAQTATADKHRQTTTTGAKQGKTVFRQQRLKQNFQVTRKINPSKADVIFKEKGKNIDLMDTIVRKKPKALKGALLKGKLGNSSKAVGNKNAVKKGKLVKKRK